MTEEPDSKVQLPVRYFVQNQFIVTYEINTSDPNAVADQMDSISSTLKSVLSDSYPTLQLNQTTPLTRYDDYGEPATTLLLFSFERIVQTNPEQETGEPEILDDRDFLILLEKIQSFLASIDGLPTNPDVLPNWYLASCVPSIGGGLAMAPQPVIDNTPNPPFPNFILPAPIQAKTPGSGSVQVFLLDTIRDVTIPAQPFVAETTTSTIRGWLQGKSYPLSTSYAEQRTGATPPVTAANKIPKMGDIPIPDHGLFVAGIVNAIAGTGVNVTTIETLNPYGVGDMTSLGVSIQQIQTFVNAHPTVPVIINCSLTVYAPIGADQIELERRANAYTTASTTTTTSTTTASTSSTASAYSASTNPSTAAAELDTYQRVGNKLGIWTTKNNTTAFFPPRVVIIAAAGNDGTDAKRYGIGVIGPRYPARFDRVIGVSALNKKGKRATYSNRADKPAPANLVEPTIADAVVKDVGQQGFATLGNVKSLYLGPIPSKTRSVSGLAQWKGTSFAAGVVTGILARVLSADPMMGAPAPEIRLRDALTLMRGTNPPHQNAGGYILDVDQY